MPFIDYTADVTRSGITFIRSEIGDKQYSIYQTDEELFSKWDTAIEEICREKLCLRDDKVEFELKPGVDEYIFLEVLGSPLSILEVYEVWIKRRTGQKHRQLHPLSYETFKQE